jgi:Glycosyltransferase sugar-binding region containing DXD motif
LSGPSPDDPSSVAERGACELSPQVRAPCDVGCVEEDLLRNRTVSPASLGLAEREEELAARLLVLQVRQLKRSERHFVQARRLLVGKQLQRPVGGTPRIAEAVLEIAPGHGVMRELSEMRPGIVSVPCLEHGNGRPVQSGAASGGEPVVQSVANEDVGESEAPRGTGKVGNGAGLDRLVERFEQAFLRHVTQPSERTELELPSKHRRKHQYAVALVGEVREATGDDIANALWDGDSRPSWLNAFHSEQPHRLANEERVSLSLLMEDPYGRLLVSPGDTLNPRTLQSCTVVKNASDPAFSCVSERPDAVSTGSDRVEERSIPRVIHCIWLGSDTIPEFFRPCVESWVRHHPDWTLQLWRNDTLPPLSCQAEFERTTEFQVKYDIVRYEVLRQFGGVIVDMDVEAIRPIDPLLEGVVAFAGHRGQDRKRIETPVLGAVPHHPFFEHVVERLRETVATGRARSGNLNTSHQAGPAFLGHAVAEYGGGDLTIFPSETFYSPLTIEPPIRPDAFPEIYAVHHHFGSYEERPDARVANLQRRLMDAQREIWLERRRTRQLAKKRSRHEEWQRRAKQAEEELTAITWDHHDRSASARAAPRSSVLARPWVFVFVAWLALALFLTTFAGLDGVHRFVDDHNNFADSNFLALAAAWLVLAGLAGARSYHALPSQPGRVPTGWFVTVLLLGALPWAPMLDSDLGYLLNACLLSLALVTVAYTVGAHRICASSGARRSRP